MLDYRSAFARVREQAVALLGEQINISHPMPDMLGDIRVEKYFVYSAAPSLMRSRPFGLMIVNMEDAALLNYQDCRINDFMDSSKYPFGEKISYDLPEKIGIREFKRRQEQIEKAYETVRCIAFKNSLTVEQKEIVGEWVHTLQISVPKSLEAYYRKMGSNFFKWCEEVETI